VVEKGWSLRRYENMYVDKEKIVKEYLPVIKRIALDLKQNLPPNVEIDDLIQEGVLALLSSLERYDPRKGSLHRYVTIRIKGAMLDYLRKLDWLPRNLRKHMKEVESAMIEIESEGNEITDEEIAKRTGLNVDTVKSVRNEMIREQILMLDSYIMSTEDTVLENIPSSSNTEDEIMKEELINAVKEAINKLGDREKLVLSLRFERELSLKEIGVVLGVSESRVSQIISVALAKIKKYLEEMV
jgi:RNA polymerase sigma factor for flagellar operon FliA